MQLNEKLLKQYQKDGSISFDWTKEDYQFYLIDGSSYTMESPIYKTPAYDETTQMKYERPNAHKIMLNFNTKKHQHPYLYANSIGFEEIRNRIKKDKFAETCYENLLKQCEDFLEYIPYPFEYMDGVGIFRHFKNDGQIREALYAFSTAYILSGEEKYAKTAWLQLKSILDWPEWGYANESQFLGVSQIFQGVAYAYDALYDYLAEDERLLVAQNILIKAIRPSLFYHQIRHNRFVTNTANWNSVCNNGIIMVALAVFDIEPEIVSEMLSYCIGSLENVMKIYAPNGDYEEGSGYWQYGTGNLTNGIAVLENVLGTSYGLADSKGFDKTAYFVPYFHSTGGEYNFHDASYRDEKYATKLISQADLDSTVVALNTAVGTFKVSKVVIDRIGLVTALTKANGIYATAVEEISAGQYPIGSKQVFADAIAFAQAVYDAMPIQVNPNAVTQAQVDAAVVKLAKAQNDFQTRIASMFTGTISAKVAKDKIYNLGTKFYTDVDGKITAIKIYADKDEAGIHTVRIYSMAGVAPLAEYSWNITDETEGWKVFVLPTPLAVTKYTDYIVAVSTSSDKHYSYTNKYFEASKTYGNLHTYIGSGLFSESANSVPSSVFLNSNYYRDVVFINLPKE